ncbi:CarD family transcriptional regulator [Peribacillus alkalitolerans]|uniref:CarD family transcriptional regulator n=1 Tax=Peribacillus alkalitolerans TaxID=1550385 RepID=UPI001F083EC7
MHGAGVIEGIEEKEVLGETKQYYVIRMPINNMQVMIPMGNIEKLRIRSISDTTTLENVMEVFYNGETDHSLSWKQRYTANMEKMKTGNILDGAEVVRDLSRLNKAKALNSSEKQMLENARKFFISELGLVKGISQSEATDLLVLEPDTIL